MTERTKAIVSLAALIIVQIAALVGVQMDADAVVEVIGSLVVVAATIWAAWKNHNFTDEAAAAQSVLDSMKNGDPGEGGSDV